ncbi:hypothetical protein BKA82DRAFT_4119705 [Pisolithus tinctorius]|nr:hypothetical protein BKA82DRAFT_4119705 [Pisolithus tinctorius]
MSAYSWTMSRPGLPLIVGDLMFAVLPKTTADGVNIRCCSLVVPYLQLSNSQKAVKAPWLTCQSPANQYTYSARY